MGMYFYTFFLVTALTSGLLAYPYQSLLDPTDLCIIACDSCYKGELVVKCANECIKTEGKIGIKWTTSCRSFDFPLDDINIEV